MTKKRGQNDSGGKIKCNHLGGMTQSMDDVWVPKRLLGGTYLNSPHGHFERIFYSLQRVTQMR